MKIYCGQDEAAIAPALTSRKTDLSTSPESTCITESQKHKVC